MAPGFTFPPPPPPPPKSTAPSFDASADRGRGRGGRGQSRGRGSIIRGGRGDHHATAGQYESPSTSTQQAYPPGSYVNPNFVNGPASGSFSQAYTGQNLGASPTHGQKRKHEEMRGGSWRGGRGQGSRSTSHPMKQQTVQPKSAVAPSVPSFGAPLPFAIGQVGSIPSPAKNGLAPAVKANTLGLTPAARSPPPALDSDSEEENDEDEEAAYQKICGEKLKFEHNGEIITLETAADLRAWKEERRMQFPSQQRIEAKLHERYARMEERRRIEHETAVASGSNVGERSSRQNHGVKQQTGLSADPGRGSRVEQLRKQLLQQKSEREKEQAAKVTAEAGDMLEMEAQSAPQEGPQSDAESSSDDESDSDDGDSSGPDMQSSKTMPPEQAPPPTKAPKRPCHFFQAGGRCRYGRNCQFEHVRDESVQSKAPKEKRPKADKDGQKKTLYQRLIEQQQEAEDKLALQAIRYLGNLGLLRPANMDGTSEEQA
ncbi:Hypothetical protein D9617_10g073030 [Elsinoe fawcettii]|nr:Hypothetical protein D9617_10g073030 [Elsinoe fawcettii]